MNIGKLSGNNRRNGRNNAPSLAEQREELLAVAERIKGQREDLIKQESEINKKIAATNDSKHGIDSFDIEEVLGVDESLATLIKHKQRIEAVLKLPNCADAEFRRLSLPYLEAVAEEKTKDALTIVDRINDLENEIKSKTEQIEKERDNLASIVAEWNACITEIGAFDAIADRRDVARFTVYFNGYRQLCEKYRDKHGDKRD